MRRGVVVATIVVVIAIQGAAVWTTARGAAEPRHLPVAVAGPDEIAGLVASQNADPALDLTATEHPRAAVRDGRATAALVIDLRNDRSTIVLSSARGARFDAVAREQIGAVAAKYTTRLEVERVDHAQPPRALAFVVALGAVVLGWAGAVVATIRRGPAEDTLAGGVARTARAAAWAAAVGAVAAVLGLIGGAAPLLLGLAAAVTSYAAAATTTALQSLFGVRGLAVATAVFVLAAGPLVTGTDPTLLAPPWASLTPWTLHGAALEAVTGALFGQTARLPQACAVLGVWTAGALLVSVVARHARRRAGVTLTG